jgi:putative transposase
MQMYNPYIHNRQSIRLKNYDYSQAGLYFITIACQDHICLFGNVINENMILNDYGKIAHDTWFQTSIIRPNIAVEEFVIMPNHMHGILRIKYIIPTNSSTIKEQNDVVSAEKSNRNNDHSNHQLQSPSQTIGAIIRGYKSSVTKQLVTLGVVQKIWQRNYHEHIIRNTQTHQKIVNYILNNPKRWVDDVFYKK